jgi:hypothetical protein
LGKELEKALLTGTFDERGMATRFKNLKVEE